MNTIATIGTFISGILVGLIIRYLLRRPDSSVWKYLGSILAAILGGIALKLLGTNLSSWWNYPIGILLGLFIYTIFAMFATAPRRGFGHDKKLPRKEEDQ
jgi:hypothetical protein